MLNQIMINKNMMDEVKKAEVLEYLDEINDDLFVLSEPKSYNKLYALDKNNDYFMKLITDLDCSHDNFQESTDMLEEELLTDAISLSEKMPLLDVAKLVNELKEDPLFYGILLVTDENNRINPLHPLVASTLVDLNEDTKYSVVIFSYNTKKELKTKHLDRAEENIAHQIAASASAVDIGTLTSKSSGILDKFNRYLNGSNITRTSESLITKSDETIADIDFLIPVQLLVNSLAFPYYGTSFVRYNSNRKTVSGGHASFMNSCNISHSERNSGTTYSGSVCTGSKNKNTIEGLQTLHAANRRSPYHNSLLQAGWAEYVSKCIEYSSTILSEHFNLSTDISTPKLSYKEQWLLDNNGTYADFIAHLRTKAKTSTSEDFTDTDSDMEENIIPELNQSNERTSQTTTGNPIIGYTTTEQEDDLMVYAENTTR